MCKNKKNKRAGQVFRLFFADKVSDFSHGRAGFCVFSYERAWDRLLFGCQSQARFHIFSYERIAFCREIPVPLQLFGGVSPPAVKCVWRPWNRFYGGRHTVVRRPPYPHPYAVKGSPSCCSSCFLPPPHACPNVARGTSLHRKGAAFTVESFCLYIVIARPLHRNRFAFTS